MRKQDWREDRSTTKPWARGSGCGISNRPNQVEEEQRHNRCAAGRGKAEQQGQQGKQEAERTAAGRQSEAGTAAAEQTVAAAWQVGVAADKEGTGARGAARATGAAEAGAVAQNSSGTTTDRARASSCCGWQGANVQGDREATTGTVGSEQL